MNEKTVYYVSPDKEAMRIFEDAVKYFCNFYKMEYEVEYLDTYIFTKDGEEIGRIKGATYHTLGQLLFQLINICEKIIQKHIGADKEYNEGGYN